MEEANKEVQRPDGHQVETSALLSFIEERVCEYCWKLCSSVDQLRSHQKHYHTQCDVCGKFTSRSHLMSHMLTHSGVRPWKCEHCPKRFALRCNLVRHTLIHSGQKPFSCDLCPKSFNLKKNMQEHRLTHTKEKPFSCSQCGRKFARRSSLVRHARSTAHSYSRNFECADCGKCFINSTNLKKHSTLVHADVTLNEQLIKKLDHSTTMVVEILDVEAALENGMKVEPSPTLATQDTEHSEDQLEELNSWGSLTTMIEEVPSEIFSNDLYTVLEM